MENRSVHKYVLSNGLWILMYPTRSSGKIATQLWYKVGSKDERAGEKGLAHLLEHMIFKGTHQLSESDINLITHKLSGTCNAFTSYDYTGYLFNFPRQQWKQSFDILADCMTNCTFKTDMLNSELQAVVQELKMYKDDYHTTIFEELVSAIFFDHPYHHPIIGYKQNLWDITHESLMTFYKQHYVPNNTTLVVVGDVEPEQVLSYAKQCFEHIPARPEHSYEVYYHQKDIAAKRVTLYRDVQQPIVLFAYTIPGFSAQQSYYYELLSWILGNGRGSILYKLLVDDLHIAANVHSFVYGLFEYGLFGIEVEPIMEESVNQRELLERIQQHIIQAIEQLLVRGITQEQLERAHKQATITYLRMCEDNEKLAYVLGESFLAAGNESYVLHYLDHDLSQVQSKLIEILHDYFRPSVMHVGEVLPLLPSDQEAWDKLQLQSDEEDARIIQHRPRETEVEPGVMVHKIQEKQAIPLPILHHQTIYLDNGLKVITHHKPDPDKIELILRLKADATYDHIHKQGLMSLMCEVMLEGTKRYPGRLFVDTLEQQGISIDVEPGKISMTVLSVDLPVALDLLYELLHNATFDAHAIEKARIQQLQAITQFWDNPQLFAPYLMQKELYKDHPYSTLAVGTRESVLSITSEDIVHAYDAYITPYKAVLAIVGNIQTYDIPALAQQYLGQWHGPVVQKLSCPLIQPIVNQEIVHRLNRDQVVLCFGRPSVERLHPLYNILSLYDQIFTGGVLGSMSSRLFQLREQSGLFYTIGGSVIMESDEQPGMLFVRTIVSKDRLQQSEQLIRETILRAAETVTQHEIMHAANALMNAMHDILANQYTIAQMLLFLDRFGLPDDYFRIQGIEFQQATVASMQAAVAQLLGDQQLLVVKVGRL